MCLIHDIADHQVLPGQDDDSISRKLVSHMSFTAGACRVRLLESWRLILLSMLKVSISSTMVPQLTQKRENRLNNHLISQNRRLDTAGLLHNANHSWLQSVKKKGPLLHQQIWALQVKH